MKKIPYGKQNISQADISAVVKVLKSDFLTQGPMIPKFEEELCKYTGSKYAVVVSSGTAALHAAYFACGLKTNDELVTTPLTFAGTSNAALYLGAKVKFADIDPKTGNIDFKSIGKTITEKTKIITPVHYAGNPVDLMPIYQLAKKQNIKIVEDAAHAIGAQYQGSKIGSSKYSDATILSFHPVKHITSGEGGAVLTNDEQIYQRALLFRSHGITKDIRQMTEQNQGGWYHEMQELGFAYRMTDIQASLGISQLKKVDTFIEKRRKLANLYDQLFKDNSYFDTVPEAANSKHVYHLFPILLKKRFLSRKKVIFEELQKLGLGVQVHYIPVYSHPYYQELGYKKNICPNAELFYSREISIPIYPGLSLKDQKYIATTLEKVICSFDN